MYRVTGYQVKPHFCTSHYLAQKVAANLEERYGQAIIEDVFVGDNDHVPTGTVDYHFDNGGMIISSNNFSFKIPDLHLSCNYHDWEPFKENVEKRLRDQWRHENRYNKEFYKLHGANHILCLTNQQRDLMLVVYDANKNHYDKLHRTWHEALIKGED